MLIGHNEGMGTVRVMRYRGFLLGVLFYYVADAAWGVFAGLGWAGPLYVDTIDTACDGAEVFSKLDLAVKDGNPHDFIFSDFWMPNMNGLEFIERKRADSRFGRLPVFLVTADTEFQRDKRTELFDGILLKPLTHDWLMEVFARNSGFASNT